MGKDLSRKGDEIMAAVCMDQLERDAATRNGALSRGIP